MSLAARLRAVVSPPTRPFDREGAEAAVAAYRAELAHEDY